MSFTDWLAIYGAGLSTLIGIFEIWKYTNERGKISIDSHFYETDQVSNNEPRIYWNVNLTNSGRKAITLSRTRAKTHNKQMKPIIDNQVSAQIKGNPMEPGASQNFFMYSPSSVFEGIYEIEVTDSVGKKFVKNIKYVLED